jgi:hypothetical protein
VGKAAEHFCVTFSDMNDLYEDKCAGLADFCMETKCSEDIEPKEPSHNTNHHSR